MPVVSWEYSGHLVLIQQSVFSAARCAEGLRPSGRLALKTMGCAPQLRAQPFSPFIHGYGGARPTSYRQTHEPLTTASLPSLVRAWASSVPTLVLAA
jgi:hypothetical protein